MANFDELMKTYKPTPSAPLDTTGKFDELMKSYKPVGTPTAPTIDKEVTEDLTTKPVGRPPEPTDEVPPTETGAVLPGLAETQRKGMEAGQALGLSPYVTGGSYGTGIEKIQEEAQVAGEEISMESREGYKEWYREEGLPAAGVLLGTLAAPATGGGSFWAAIGASAAGAGFGGFVGEASEQTLKKEGVLQLGIGEEAPRNGWDILERATVKGGQEAAYDAIGGLFFRGLTHGFKTMLKHTAKPRVLQDGTVVDQGKEDLVQTIRKWANGDDEKVGQAILASQIADVAHYNFMEDVAKASYVGSKRVEKVLETQREVITGEAKEMVAGLTTEAKTQVAKDTEGFLGQYYKANMDNTSDFVVAGLVRKAFTDAQNQQKSIARSIYRTMDDLANATTVKQVMEEKPTGFFYPDGRPIMSLNPVTREVNNFPVQMQEVREWAADKLDESLLKADPVLGELMELPKEASMKQVGEALAELKGRSRTLQDAIKMGTAAENAPRRKLLLDEAITMMEKNYDDAINLADEAGIRAPDGRTLRDLKDEADSIWAQQVKDFQNSAINNILQNTDLVNGAPDELVTQFLKSPANAEKVLNAIKIGKDTLEGDALNNVLRAEEMIKGSVVERILLPMDPISKSYGLPDMASFTKNSSTLKMLLGDETYEATRRLVSAAEQHAKSTKSSTMAYAQKAREAGMTIQAVKGAVDRDPAAIGSVSSTLIVALGAGRILTKPRNLKFAETLDNPEVSPAYKRRALRYLIEEWTSYMQEQEDALSPEKRMQLKEQERLRMEDIEMGRVAQ